MLVAHAAKYAQAHALCRQQVSLLLPQRFEWRPQVDRSLDIMHLSIAATAMLLSRVWEVNAMPPLAVLVAHICAVSIKLSTKHVQPAGCVRMHFSYQQEACMPSARHFVLGSKSTAFAFNAKLATGLDARVGVP